MADDDRFDGMFFTIAQQAQGIEPLLDTMFSFLRRKTDFFVGASEEKIQEVVQGVVAKHAALNAKEAAEKKARAEKEAKKKAERLAAQKKKEEEELAKKKAAESTKSGAEEVIELGSDGTFDTATTLPPAVPAASTGSTGSAGMPPAPPADVGAGAGPPATEGTEGTEGGKAEEEEDNTPPPVGNGGKTDKYVWTQTLQDLIVNIPLPPGTKAKMLNVDMRNTKLLVAMKGGETIVDGDLYKRIVVDDSFWTIEDGELVISMQKDNKMEWWKTVIQGDTEINTSKVQPENSKLGDLDAETRQTVEKMMFDQQQKAMGKPSSDELQKQEMLNKFMKAHPEMDFSQAKFS